MAIQVAETTFHVLDLEPVERDLPETSYADAVGFYVCDPGRQIESAKSISEQIRSLNIALEQNADLETQRQLREWLDKSEIELEETRLTGPVEATSRGSGRLLKDVTYHPFVAALSLAYALHRPIRLSPDMIWLLICQGVAIHINQNSKALRSELVDHSGKVELAVVRGPNERFEKGSPGNRWPEVVRDFSQSIRRQSSATYSLFLPSFSTTGSNERTACEVALMDAMQKYFDYRFVTVICGIPSITLEGTQEDWQAIRDRLAGFASLGLDWWLAPLGPILDQFVEASMGQTDRDFWRNIYRTYEPDAYCVPDSAVGWITAFFPYLTDKSGHTYYANPWLTGEKEQDLILAPPNEKFIAERLKDVESDPSKLPIADLNLSPLVVSRLKRYGIRTAIGVNALLKTGDAHTQAVLGLDSESILQLRQAMEPHQIAIGRHIHEQRDRRQNSENGYHGIYDSQFPVGLSRAPFIWEERDLLGRLIQTWEMEFVAGFVGIAQDHQTRALRPEIGWAVRERVSS